MVCNLSGVLVPAEISRISRSLNASNLNSSTDSVISNRESPPSKRSRKEINTNNQDTVDYKRPLEYIKRLLASPNICELLKTQYSICLNKFCEVSFLF